MKETPAFLNFLRKGIAAGGFRNDDVVAVMLPLLEDLKEIHSDNQVLDWKNLEAIKVTSGIPEIDFELRLNPRLKSDALQVVLLQARTDAFEIRTGFKQTGESGPVQFQEFVNAHLEKYPKLPVFLPGYTCWEIEFGHHDQSGDIFMAGLLLASLSLNLDFTNENDLRLFVENRDQIPVLNKNIHPAIANLLVEMTQPDRRKRTREISEAIERLKFYREYREELVTDLTRMALYRDQSEKREHFIFRKLKSRLFDLSKRNKLLYFKPNMRFLNLTVSSVPSVLNIQNISPDQLFIWNRDIRKKVADGSEINLNRYLSFSDYPFIIPALNKIRIESNKDIQEYGFSQLRLAVAFLNWSFTENNVTESIVSPLVLIPVKLIRKKGVREQFVLECLDTEAEINPVLAHRLKELYAIQLPEAIDLEKNDLEDLYKTLRNQILSSASGIDIDFIVKPRIAIIHAEAKKAVQRFNRKLSGKNALLSQQGDFTYSYDSNHFVALGLQLFQKHIAENAAIPEFLMHPESGIQKPDSENSQHSENVYFQPDRGGRNPLRWEFDTCNMTLGNFNFRKMSLVRDYDQILTEQKSNPVFSELFSDSPLHLKPAKKSEKTYNITGLFQVIPSDPTQNNAVRMARMGRSYLIQGPPGTGKSQTITNLIADLVACGKKVLFVCEKRTALDVVYSRLKQQKLHELCSLIHDSQSDKKEFVQDLGRNYHALIAEKSRLADVERDRNLLLLSIGNTIRQLDEFHHALQIPQRNAGLPLYALYRRLIGLKSFPDNHGENDFTEDLPSYFHWLKSGECLRSLSKEMLKHTGESVFAKHPIARLHKRFLSDVGLFDELKRLIGDTVQLLSELAVAGAKIGLHAEQFERFSELEKFVGFFTPLKFLAEQNLTALLHASSDEFKALLKHEKDISGKEKQCRDFEHLNAHWFSKFSKSDLSEISRQWSSYEKNIFRFFIPGYYKLKKYIRKHYNFSAHAIRPAISVILNQLEEEYRIKDSIDEALTDFVEKYGYDHPSALVKEIKGIHRQKQSEVMQFLNSKPDAAACILEMNRIGSMLIKAEIKLSALMSGFREMSFSAIEEWMEEMSASMEQLPELVPYLNELMQAEDVFVQTVRTVLLQPDQLETAMALKSLQALYRNNKTLQHTEGSHILYLLEKLQKEHLQLLDYNAEWIREKQKERILNLLRLSEQSAARLSKVEKERKKTILDGRKILENEFSKSMRYKSIRDLSKMESGLLIRELKPVWLMSPLSVSDTLPLDESFFDIVIFDEASQITLEEGVPSLFRSGQSIIVGDEMQMPPGNFFSATTKEQDDLWQLEESDDFIHMDADSLLNQAARKLPSVMLGWHYRSRYESLIGFSNAAFYENKLLTVPDRKTFSGEQQVIVVRQSHDAKNHWEQIYTRSISYHFLEKGCYEKRINIPEAEYIAALVFELLHQGKGDSIGIVAFSQEQQMEIEDALERFAAENPVLQVLLENEYKRNDEDQFVGLFVKNLENVQGDERDIIIMSVCYGYNTLGKMHMNFGPINRRGGEKRLNVLFSRAKKHMVVVSSIRHSDIRNEYNEGANYLKRYLRYAELISSGKIREAMEVLRNLSVTKHADDAVFDPVAEEIAGKLREKGWVAETQVGQSQFKCSIALKKKESDEEFALGILLDDEAHYSDQDAVGVLYQRPRTLVNFGWRVIQVFTKDWYHQPQKVLLQIEKAFRNEKLTEEPLLGAFSGETGKNTSPVLNRQSVAPAKDLAQTEKGLHSDSTQYFELNEGQTIKYWEINAVKNKLYTRFGNKGKSSKVNERIFVTENDARREMERLIRQKESKGYQRIS